MMYQGLLDVVPPSNDQKSDSVVELESIKKTLNLKVRFCNI